MDRFGPGTGVEKLQAELKRKAAQLNQADNKLQLLANELAKEKAEKAELQQAQRRNKGQVMELSSALSKAQVLLKQRDAALSSLTGVLDAARSRPGSGGAPAPIVTSITPKGPLSRQNSDEEALVAELHDKSRRIKELEAELTVAKSKAAELTPRRPNLRDSVEESGLAVVGGSSGVSSYEANCLRSLRTECASWRDRSESLMAQVKELQRAVQASDIEKAQLADSASELSEKCRGLEEALRGARDSLAALRAVADQGRGELKGELQRRDSDLSRMAAQHEAQASLIDELKAQVEKQGQDREHLVLQAQQLQAQLARASEEAREGNLRVAQLVAQLDDKVAALESSEAEVKSVTGSRFSREAFVADLQFKLAEVIKEKAEVEVHMRQVMEQLSDAVEEKERLQELVKATRERAEAAELSAAALKQQVVEARKEADVEQRRYAEAMVALDAKEHELGDRTKEARDAVAMVQQSQGAIDLSHSRTNHEVAEMREQLATQAVALENLEAEMNTARATAENMDHVKGLSSQHVGKLSERLAAAQKEAQEAQERAHMASDHCDELEAELQARDEELGKRMAKIAQLEVQLKQMEALSQKVSEGEYALQRASNASAAAAAELVAANQVLADRQLALETAHAVAAEKDCKLALLETDLRQTQAVVATLERQLQEREERLMEHERGAAAVCMEIADFKTELRTAEMEQEDLKRDLGAARAEAARLSSRVSQLEAEAEAARKRLQALSDDLEEARAPFMTDQETKRQLQETLQELAAERSAHDAIKQVLKQEAATTAAGAAPASPTAAVQLESDMVNLQLAAAQQQLAERTAVEHVLAAAAKAEEEVKEDVPAAPAAVPDVKEEEAQPADNA